MSKGQAPDTDGYSAFEGTLPDGTPLGDALAAGGVRELVVCGLATDYCVRASVLDAIRHGFRVAVVSDAIAGVDPAGGESAAAEMRDAGATLTTVDAALAAQAPAGAGMHRATPGLGGPRGAHAADRPGLAHGTPSGLPGPSPGFAPRHPRRRQGPSALAGAQAPSCRF